MTPEERAFFLEEGYLHAKGVVTGEHLAQIQREFDQIWATGRRCSQHELLTHKTFIDLVEHPAILDRHKAIFGNQVQLLQYDFLRQEAHNTTFPLRSWHRDFVFPGDYPLSINTILYLDDMTAEKGPTYVVPKTHRGVALPPKDRIEEPIEGEVPVYANAGDAVFINAAIWHTGSRNQSAGLRRGIYLYYGYWWLKTYDAFHARPWQCLENADPAKLALMGARMPDWDIHMYDPTKGF
jgi:hypothetical protein